MASNFHGYVALGDSFTEGMNDWLADGTPRGWADMVAERLAKQNPHFSYANLAIRGRLFDAVVDEQVPPALRMRPDLVSFVAGGNDAMRPGFHPGRMAGRLNEVVRVLTASGAHVLLCTVTAVPSRLPASRLLRRRLEAMNDLIRTVSARHDAILVDVHADEFNDDRMWSEDRIHMSTAGHHRVATHVCHALDTEPDPEWSQALPGNTRAGFLTRRREDMAWARSHFAPWVRRRITGRSSGDDVDPKRPKLTQLPS